MYIEGYINYPWNFLLGVCYNTLPNESRLEIFLICFVVAFVFPEEGE